MPRVSKKTAMPPSSSKPSLRSNVAASPIAFGDGKYVGEVVNSKPHGKGRFTIGDIDYLGDWHEGNMHGNGMMKLANYHIMVEGVWDKGGCVRAEIVYFVNGMKWVATNEDGKGSMVLEDGSKHFGVGMWLDVIDWLLKGPVIANGISIIKPIENTSSSAKINEKMLVVGDEIGWSLTLKPLCIESVLADLIEMKSRIQFVEENVLDSTTTTVLKDEVKSDSNMVDTNNAENQATDIMAKPPVRIAGDDTKQKEELDSLYESAKVLTQKNSLLETQLLQQKALLDQWEVRWKAKEEEKMEGNITAILTSKSEQQSQIDTALEQRLIAGEESQCRGSAAAVRNEVSMGRPSRFYVKRPISYRDLTKE